MKVISAIALVLVSAVTGCSAMREHPDEATDHNRIGVALYKKGDLDGAIQELRQALNLNPNFAEAHTNLGGALLHKGDLDGAIQEYRQAISLDPNSATAHDGLGAALYKKGDLDGAIQEFRQALSLNPNFAMSHDRLGTALVQKGDLDGAIQEYRQALGGGSGFELTVPPLTKRRSDQPASTTYRRASTRNPSASARRITVERDGLTCSPLAASGGSSASALAISATGMRSATTGVCVGFARDPTIPVLQNRTADLMRGQ